MLKFIKEPVFGQILVKCVENKSFRLKVETVIYRSYDCDGTDARKDSSNREE